MLEKVVAESIASDVSKYAFRASKSLIRVYAAKMCKEKMQRAILNSKRILYMYLNNKSGLTLSAVT